MFAAAVSLGTSVNYQSVGTVEFIYDGKRDDFYFLEVNTRLQVEHPITEAVTGLDLVEWMLLIAAGMPPALESLPTPRGAAMEVRLYAEDPLRNFQPSPGTLTEVIFPDQEWVRVDSWISAGSEVSPHYDPMLAKLIVHGSDRADALQKLQQALDATSLGGIASNLEYLRSITRWQRFVDGDVATQALNVLISPPGRWRSWRPVPTPRYRIIQAGSGTGISVYRLPAPWMIAPSVWATDWWATARKPLAWSVPS